VKEYTINNKTMKDISSNKTLYYIVLNIFFVGLICSGCTATQRLITQSNNTNNKSVATIKGSEKVISKYSWEKYIVLAVDGKKTSLIFRDFPNNYKILINPGLHNVMVYALFYREGLPLGTYSATTIFQVQVQQDSIYEVQGEVDGDEFILWIKDLKTGKLVTEKKHKYFNYVP